ncbi:hypothetical protein [Vulcanisaeta sp. JCM 14467]
MSKGLIIGVVVIVIVVAALAGFLMPGLLRPHVTKSTPPLRTNVTTSKPTPPPPPPQEVALNNSLALLKGQYTVWMAMNVSITLNATSSGFYMAMPFAVINSSGIEVSYSNVTGLKLLISGPATVTVLFPTRNTTQVPIGLAMFTNTTSLCAAVSPAMARFTNTTVPPGYTSALGCTPMSELSNVTAYVNYLWNGVIENLTYIGNSTWNGQTTYCFATKEPVVLPLTSQFKSILPANATRNLVNATLSISITNLCLLESGYATSIQGAAVLSFTILEPYSNQTLVPAIANFNVSFTASLTNYTSAFDSQGFNALLKNPYIQAAQAISIT